LFWTENKVKTLYFAYLSTESEQKQRNCILFWTKNRVTALYFAYSSTVFDI